LSTRVASRHLGSQWVIRRERERGQSRRLHRQQAIWNVFRCIEWKHEWKFVGRHIFLATFETRKTVGALNSFTLVISHHSPPTNWYPPTNRFSIPPTVLLRNNLHTHGRYTQLGVGPTGINDKMTKKKQKRWKQFDGRVGSIRGSGQARAIPSEWDIGYRSKPSRGRSPFV
jgi:hypothetical protein